MKFAYADFATTGSLPDYYGPIEVASYEAGKAWARQNTKLPGRVQVGDREVPIARSSHPFARAFVAGFKSVSR